MTIRSFREQLHCLVRVAGVSALSACAAVSRTGADEAAGSFAALRIEIEVAELAGALMIALFDDAKAYEGDGAPVRGARVAAGTPPLVALFEGLPPGRYAVRAVHDLIGDGKLGVNPLGTPMEPFAFSNGATVRFGPPSFDEAALDLSAGTTTDVLEFWP